MLACLVKLKLDAEECFEARLRIENTEVRKRDGENKVDTK